MNTSSDQKQVEGLSTGRGVETNSCLCLQCIWTLRSTNAPIYLRKRMAGPTRTYSTSGLNISKQTAQNLLLMILCFLPQTNTEAISFWIITTFAAKITSLLFLSQDTSHKIQPFDVSFYGTIGPSIRLSTKNVIRLWEGTDTKKSHLMTMYTLLTRHCQN